MISENEIDTILENYGKLVSRAQHVYNRLYTELYQRYGNSIFSWSEAQLFHADTAGYDLIVRPTEGKPDYIDFGTPDRDRDGDYIGFVEIKKEFLYNDDALTTYIKEETEKQEENKRRERERDAERRKLAKEKEEEKERAEYERLKAKYG